jgi:CubicO group peptidase (beta-lactamase class C family)
MPSRRSLFVTSSAALLGATLLSKRSALAAAVAATPAFKPTRLDRATRRAAGLQRLHGLVVARHGRIALAEAFRGPPLDRPVNVKSVSKTLVASLAGAAIDRRLLAGVDLRLDSLLGDLIPAGADPRVRDLTVAHLLTMQGGSSAPPAPTTAAGSRAPTGSSSRSPVPSWPSPARACSTRPAAIICWA